MGADGNGTARAPLALGAREVRNQKTMQIKFPEVSKAEWLAKVEKDLRGKPLAGLDFEVAGATFSPLHHQDDHPAFSRPFTTATDCKLGIFIEVADPISANKLALEALMGGANYLYFYDPHYAGKAGYKDQLYAGIMTDIVDVVWHNRPYQVPVHDLEAISHTLLRFSNTPGESTIWLAPGPDYLTNIAFLRAARLCASLIVSHQPKITGFQLGLIINGDAADPNTAKIRATAHAMAGMIGGADILMIKPSDNAGETAFERRIARNIHHLLTEESHLGAVDDPAAGAYYIEALTDHLANKIWTEFQELCN